MGTGARFRPGDCVGVTRFGAYATVIHADVEYLRPIAPVGASKKPQPFPRRRSRRHSFGTALDRALAALGAPGRHRRLVSAVCLRTPAAGGRYVFHGPADFMPAGARPGYLRLAVKYVSRPRIDPLAMISAYRSVMAFNLIWLWDPLDQLAAGWDELNALVTTPPLVGRRFPFAEAPAAMRYLQSGQSVGKWCWKRRQRSIVVLRAVDSGSMAASHMCYTVVMSRRITQRELRNESGRIMRALDKGEAFTVTRNGVPVGELVPVRPRVFVPAEAVAAAYRHAPRIARTRFRRDVDSALSQDPTPRG